MINRKSSINLDGADLQEISDRTRLIHENFRDARILILGGTGFLGSWLIEAFLKIQSDSNLKCQILAPVRSPEKLSFLESNFLKVVHHDFATDRFLVESGDFDYVFHALTPTTSGDFDPILGITERLFEDIQSWRSQPKFIHLSSGAIYPKSISSQGPVVEQNAIYSQDLGDYGKLKWEIERIVNDYTKQGVVRGINPRLFAFAGPRLPLDAHFAVGNFMRQGLSGKDVVVSGNRNTVRSYLHPVDAITWLMKSSLIETLEILHIGSSVALSMNEIAEKISQIFNVGYRLEPTEQLPSIYYPSNNLTRDVLGMSQELDFESSINRWKSWLNRVLN